MDNRLDLHTLLENILGTSNVYYDPPESIKMTYDAIRYRRRTISNVFANDSVYGQNNCYEIIVIYRDPDSDIPRKLSMLPMCSHDRHYVAENLHHDVFTLYY